MRRYTRPTHTRTDLQADILVVFYYYYYLLQPVVAAQNIKNLDAYKNIYYYVCACFFYARSVDNNIILYKPGPSLLLFQFRPPERTENVEGGEKKKKKRISKRFQGIRQMWKTIGARASCIVRLK